MILKLLAKRTWRGRRRKMLRRGCWARESPRGRGRGVASTSALTRPRLSRGRLSQNSKSDKEIDLVHNLAEASNDYEDEAEDVEMEGEDADGKGINDHLFIGSSHK